MNERQTPQRMLRITIVVLCIGIVGLLLWLSIAPPAAYASYQPWFWAVLSLFVGIVFTAWNSWKILRFGPTRDRIAYIVIGLIFLINGLLGVLHH